MKVQVCGEMIEVEHFQSTGNSPLWNEIMRILETVADAEAEAAISVRTTGEQRIHQCGVAAGARNTVDMLNEIRDSALASLN